MKKNLFALLFSIASLCVWSQEQKTVKLNIQHWLGAQTFGFNLTSSNNLGHSFALTRLQYYLSGFEIVHDGGQTTAASNIFALVDASQNTSIELGSFGTINTIEGIRFAVGVNTPVNNQDPALWPATHPLSPKSPSMHWGWSSGYIFVALEGNCGPAVNQVMQLHALGNMNHHQQSLTTGATATGNELLITLKADYTKALSGIDVSAGAVLHGTSGKNQAMLKNFRDSVFQAIPTQTVTTHVSATSFEGRGVDIYPNPTTGKITVETKGFTAGTPVTVTDSNGKVICEVLSHASEKTPVEILVPGIYFVQVKGASEIQKIVVH